MKKKLKILLIATISGLLISSCNLFSPGGSAKPEDDNADALISYAQSLFRKAEYATAAEYYAKAIAADSTKSEAYFGLAKSGMREAGANPMLLLNIISESSTGSIPFMDDSLEIQNIYYRSMRAIDTALAPLIHRDTLTELWEYAVKIDEDPSYESTLNDTLVDRITAFRNSYKKGSEYLYGTIDEKFPLTDRKYKYPRFQVDYTLAKFSVMILGFLDLNRDGSLDEKDFPIKINIDPETGNISVDISGLMDNITTNPEVADAINDNLELLASGSGDLTSIIEDMAGSLGLESDSGSSMITEETKAQLDSTLQSFGDAALFYKLGDKKDNDGDGCLDEELFDSTDNDMDGFVDEDLRLSNPLLMGVDQVDNDANGQTDEAAEYTTSTAKPRPYPFTSAFVAIDTDEYNTTNLELKIAITKDTLGTVYPLAVRKSTVGGCWVNYNETSFQAYLTAHRN